MLKMFSTDSTAEAAFTTLIKPDTGTVAYSGQESLQVSKHVIQLRLKDEPGPGCDRDEHGPALLARECFRADFCDEVGPSSIQSVRSGLASVYVMKVNVPVSPLPSFDTLDLRRCLSDLPYHLREPFLLRPQEKKFYCTLILYYHSVIILQRS